MREKQSASCTLPTGDVPATKVHALDRNQTWDPSVRRLTLYPLSQTGFGQKQSCFIGVRKTKQSESCSFKFILFISRKNSHAISHNSPITMKANIHCVFPQGPTWHTLSH